MARDACAELPPVQAEYTPKGKWEELGGLKSYITGPPDAKAAVVFVYDIFGPAPQILQGADRLAAHTASLVVMPDFFEGEAPSSGWFPVDTDEKKERFAKFRAEKAGFEGNGEKLLAVRKALGERWPGVEGHVGVFGLCWGGKVAVLATGAGNEGAGRHFTVSGTAHPGRLELKDYDALTAPHICLASPDEPQDVVEQIKALFAGGTKTGHAETVPATFHGWMGARSNLKDEKNVKQFEDGYKQVAEYFLAHL